MKATQLRLGNLVQICSDPTFIDHVLILEPGQIHLESGKDFEEESNIIGVPIRELLIEKYGIPANTWFFLGGKKVYIGITQGRSQVQLHIEKWIFRVRYMHELQNIAFDITGEELITHPNIHTPYGGE
jgi:hypothetical protein